MGVYELWSILEPVKQHFPLHSLGGKTLAVDLSIWVCEAQSVKRMVGVVTKPHLRNLFFRVLTLNLLGVKLVFVTEGEPPKIKMDTIIKRAEMRYGTSINTGSSRAGRSYFQSVLKECLRLLECLGVPWVQAAGEAEAMCAYLNANGYVDGCITNDGDVFLYGARTVYRNFTMNVKDPHVDCYEVSSVNQRLGLDRDALVGLAILLGCDYLPKGMPGVGKDLALKLIESLKGESLLQRFYQWKKQFDDQTVTSKSTKKTAHCTVCCHPGSAKQHEKNGCKFCGSDRYCEPHDYDYCCPCDWHVIEREKRNNPVEFGIRKKAKRFEGFPFNEVIQEFTRNKDKLTKVLKWSRPSLLAFQNFASERMEWPKHYACDKLLALLTHYDMNERKAGRKTSTQLQPIRILKTRIRNGIPCFEIEWLKPDSYVFGEDQPPESSPVTIEEESLFQAAYPDVVTSFHKEKLEVEENKQKSKKCKPKSKVSPDPDDIASLLSEMSLKPTSEKLFLPDMCASLVTTQNVNKEHNTTSLPCDLQVDSVPPPKLEYSLEKDKECAIFTPLSNLDEMKSLDNICSSPVPGNAHQHVASSPNISTLISELQLSSIDWESTSFTKSPQVETRTGTDVKGNFEFDDFKAHLGYKATTNSPAITNSSLEKMTKEIIETNISGVSLEKPTKDEIKPRISNLENGLEKPTKEIVKSNICNVRNKKETLSSREPMVEHLQTLPLKERILLKNAHSCAPYPLNSNNKVSMKLAPLSLHKIECTKSASSVSSSAPCTTGVGVVEKQQLSKEEWVSRDSTLQENRKPSVVPLKQMSTNTSTSVRSYTFVKDIKKTSLQPIKTIYAENNYTKNEKQMVSKLHVKKSTCHKRSSSSEDSDRENGGSRFSKEMHIKNKSSLNHVLKMERDVANVNTHITSQTLTSAPLAIHEIHSPDKKSANSRVSNTSEESDADDSIIAVDSPLPLAERLKLRLLQSQ